MTSQATQAHVSAPADGIRLLTAEEVAEALGLRVRYVQRMLAERVLPVVKIGRLVRVRHDDVVAFIESNTEAGKADR